MLELAGANYILKVLERPQRVRGHHEDYRSRGRKAFGGNVGIYGPATKWFSGPWIPCHSPGLGVYIPEPIQTSVQRLVRISHIYTERWHLFGHFLLRSNYVPKVTTYLSSIFMYDVGTNVFCDLMNILRI